MRVNVNELQEGCILTEDVYSLTNRPILQKKTVLTKEILEVLHAFLIRDVVVEKKLVNGMLFTPEEILENESDGINIDLPKKEIGFIERYLEGVQEYKHEFKNWQAGMPIDISKIRNIMIPLVESSEANPSELFSLHHLSINEEYLFQHSIAVGLISAFIGKKLKMSKGNIVQLAIGGCLSDSGMAKVKPAILNKNTPLTSQEMEEIKKHPAFSYRLIQNISLLREETKVGILQHHERLDGSGYPLGKKDNEINAFAKSIAVADTFHAMTCNRLYRRKQSPFKVLEMMLQEGFGKYDIKALKAIGSGIMTFSTGSRVKLSNDQIAEILFIEELSPTRPLVKIIETGEIMHLEKNRRVFIEEVLR